MNSFLGLVLFVLLTTIVLFWWGHRSEEANRGAETVQAVLTAGALLLAGYWYFVERKGQPHANVTQAVFVQHLQRGYVLVESHVSVQNLGSRLLKINQARMRLQQVSPALYPYDELAKKSGPDYWAALKPLMFKGKPVRYFNELELSFPLLREYNGPVRHEVEPGETDLLVTSFIVPCTAKVVRITASLQKDPGDEGSEPMVWKARNFADITQWCNLRRE
jgi:hypothetical protein